MPRPNLILTNEHPYHIRARSNNCDWFDLPPNYCYGIFANVIPEVIERYKVNFHSFVLMNNHLHMLVSTPLLNLSAAMRYFMTETARGIRIKSKRMNHVYGGRYKWSVVQDERYYAHCFKYVFRNPVRAGIVDKVEDYQWSTASKVYHRMKDSMTELQLGHDIYVPKRNNELQHWLNEPTPKEIEEAIAKGLRKSIVEVKPDRKTQKMPDLLNGLPIVARRIHKK